MLQPDFAPDPQSRFIFAGDQPKKSLRAHIARESHRKERIRRIQEYQESKKFAVPFHPSKRRVSFRRNSRSTIDRKPAQESEEWVPSCYYLSLSLVFFLPFTEIFAPGSHRRPSKTSHGKQRPVAHQSIKPRSLPRLPIPKLRHH